MAVFAKELLSGSTNGRGSLITATATPGNIFHTATNVAGELDEVYVYLYNSHTADVEVTFELGGTTDPDDHNVLTVPADAGLLLAIPGLVFNGGVNLRAFASVASVVTIFGFVNNISQ